MVIIQDDHGKPSMLEKSLERRRVNREHNSNFRAGHVAVHEGHLHKTGLRGRKSYLAVGFLICLALAALINLILTLWIIFGLHINRHGSKVFDFLPEGTLQFQVPSDLQQISLSGEGVLGGFKNEDLCLFSEGSNVTIQRHAGSSVFLEAGDTRLRGGSFDVINPESGRRVFSTIDMNNLKLDPSTRVRSEGPVQVNQIVSPTGKGLLVKSEESLHVRGHKGANFRARRINLAGQDVELFGVGQLTLESQSSSGVYLNSSLLPQPIVGPPTSSSVYRLCMCGANGRIFGVNISASSVSPCQELSDSFDLCD